MPAVERAVFDLAAIVIRHDLAAADAAADGDALAGESVAELAPAGDDEIGRPAISGAVNSPVGTREPSMIGS